MLNRRQWTFPWAQDKQKNDNKISPVKPRKPTFRRYYSMVRISTQEQNWLLPWDKVPIDITSSNSGQKSERSLWANPYSGQMHRASFFQHLQHRLVLLPEPLEEWEHWNTKITQCGAERWSPACPTGVAIWQEGWKVGAELQQTNRCLCWTGYEEESAIPERALPWQKQDQQILFLPR